jgi:3'-phosphoadenosine 5'-phosphosulfate sulfotransferase (PAPS reductase)/FAD synthetase
MSCTACPTITRPIKAQTELWDTDLFRAPKVEFPILLDYDQYVIAFSGGKDCVSAFLSLLEMGVPRHKIELIHHDVDGREEGKNFMDWPCTPAYCRAFAAAFSVRLYFSWREGGFRREMLRDKTATARTHFETPTGLETRGGNSGKLGTRRIFPQVTSKLSQRWCSSSLKIDVADIAIRNQPRFNNCRTLVISGERAQESSARAGYKIFERDRADARNGPLKRHIDRCRLVHQWDEIDVWEIIARWRVNMHPAYRLNWGRLSCALCIFGSANQWASAKVVFPDQFKQIADYEREFGKTIDRGGMGVIVKASLGKAYPACSNAALVAEARNEHWNGRIILDEGEWELPAGAFGESNGPT